MDHLDLNGMFSHSTSTSSWLLSPFDQQEANVLSSSRQILEPIIEETSEDEETHSGHCWSNQFEGTWSSESDTGSVIRVGILNDQDSISERDFACPAKRPRRSDDLHIVEDPSPLRRFVIRNETTVAIKIDGNEVPSEPLYRKRFDELCSESDTISFNSLSRSSSLIQFESLERQMQGDLTTTIGNSSPSLLNFDCSEGHKGSDGNLRRFESSDGRLHQTYYDLDKIDFDDSLIFNSNQIADRISSYSAKSDSESSSDNSILSHEERISKPAKSSSAREQRSLYRGKNSVENLSEDSGYCENYSALRNKSKSKSIPNFLSNCGKFCEEEEFENHKSLETICIVNNFKEPEPSNIKGENGTLLPKKNASNEISKSRNIKMSENYEMNGDFNTNDDSNFPQANNFSFSSNGSTKKQTHNISLRMKIDAENVRIDEMNRDTKNSRDRAHANRRKASRKLPICTSIVSELSYISLSLPDVRQFDREFEVVKNSCDNQLNNSCLENNSSLYSLVSSVPNNLNFVIENESESYRSVEKIDYSNSAENTFWNLRSPFSISENRLVSPNLSKSATVSTTKTTANYASYSNLTVLDYSGRSNRNSFNMSDYNSKRNSRELSELGKGNFLLDELSENFDRDLSILSDRRRDSDLMSEFHEKDLQFFENSQPPKTPARGGYAQKKNQKPVQKPHRETQQTPRKTFDQDPTNLRTSYAESLEKCNFDPNELSSNDLREIPAYFKRGFVASSTPNLNTFKSSKYDGGLYDDYYISSAHTSMNLIPGEKKLGILLPTSNPGSRNSLAKGVSFCPVVSEISWIEPSSKECMDLDSLENISLSGASRKNTQILQVQEEDLKLCNVARQTEKFIVDTTGVVITAAINNAPLNMLDEEESTTGSSCFSLTDRKIHQIEQQQRQNKKNCHSVGAQVNKNPASDDHGAQQSVLRGINSVGSSNSSVLIAEVNGCFPSTALTSGRSDRDCVVGNANEKHQSVYDHKNFSARDLVDTKRKMNNTVKSVNSNNTNNVQETLKINNKHFNNCNALENSSKMANFTKNTSKNINPVGISGATTSLSANNNLAKSYNGNGSNSQMVTNSKFKPKPDEKHHKTGGGFLSRFTGGFRFSLRRKNKAPSALPAVDKNTNDTKTVSTTCYNNKNLASGKKSVADGAKKTGNSGVGITASGSPEFIYIPLKGPETILENDDILKPNVVLSLASDRQNHVLLTGKPPLPKQPPRVIGVCEKVRSAQLLTNGDSVSGSNAKHAPNSIRSSYPTRYDDEDGTDNWSREIDERFLDNERDYYHTNRQLNATMNTDGCINETLQKTLELNLQIPSRNATATGQNGARIGLIETNLDTHETVISGKTQSLMELGGPHHYQPKRSIIMGPEGIIHLNPMDASDVLIEECTNKRPHKSMEFLLDKENQRNVLPPENELQKSHDSTVALSEHQLRVQASLQRLNIPDWYRQYSSTPKSGNESFGYKPGSFTRKRTSESGRWAGLNSKTTSLSSLGSQRSDRSPLMLSPSANSHHGGQMGFSRWSTSQLNSNQTSPSVSTRGSFSRGVAANSSFISGHSVQSGSSIRSSFRQPYLGWRSQEKLSQPRTAHERLSSSLLIDKPTKPILEPAVTPEIQSSIKEVTSAIVHYVNDQTNRTSRSRSASPNSRLCWLESSFVGIRPLDSPQTPDLENGIITSKTGLPINHSNDLRLNGVATGTTQNPTLTLPQMTDCPPSPNSASLEDVLASLLGLPSEKSYRATGDTLNTTTAAAMMEHRKSTSASPNSLLQVDLLSRLRRRSADEAQNKKQHFTQKTSTNNYAGTFGISSTDLPSRRVSLDSSESKTASEVFVKCRNTKCDQSANHADAKKYYKSCHNCSHVYCSRECRRQHWDKHRKACLHSRVSNLCRQVLSSCKDDKDTLRNLSLLARKGYLSQGRGVVRILFRSPESAENFIKNGFQCLGEASYVRWPDLMPAEMGLELYSELLRLSTEYKPEAKMLIYVAICVVSEAPASATAAVKWERQLVSRCAKLKLCKTILSEMNRSQHTVFVQEPSTEIIILTFNQQKRSGSQREVIMNNIQRLLLRKGVMLRKHYPEIFQRIQTYVEGQTDRFMPVTIHPRDSETGQGFVCIIMPNHADGGEIITIPNSDAGNRVETIDVGEEVLES